MDITFLIGNGFDLNMGLKTSYSSFLEEYAVSDSNGDRVLKEFKHNIKKDLPLWSSAELALGAYTNHFQTGEKDVNDYLNCHTDFCEKLADYLTRQEAMMDYEKLQDDLARLFANALGSIRNGFRTVSKEKITKCMNSVGSGYRYNFVSFNYTYTLDRCVEYTKKLVNLGSRSYNGTGYSNTLGALYHIHGYIDRDMVLGVNDESQLGNIDLFKDAAVEDIGQVIKRKTNELNEEQMDEKVHKLISSSDLIYIYGMSLGASDAIWWNRICKCMQANKNLRIIIYAHNAPPETLLRRRALQYDNEVKNNFLRYGDITETQYPDLLDRIHIDHSNIFQDLGVLVQNSLNDELSIAPVVTN